MSNKLQNLAGIATIFALIIAILALMRDVWDYRVITGPLIPTETTSPKSSPSQFMKNYYTNINENRFKEAWKMLTPSFQTRKSSSYSGYYNWWNSIDRVEIQDVSLISQDSNSATVFVQISYIINGEFKKENPQYFTLVWNSVINNWQINHNNVVSS